MRSFVILVSLVGLLFCGNSFAITCGDASDTTEYKINYSCGAGTVKSGQTLPAATTVKYGQSVQPENITTTYCSAPADHMWNGQVIVVDDKIVAIHANNQSRMGAFKYRYTHDITVQPNWVPLVTKELARERADLYIGHEWNGWPGNRFDAYWGNWSWVSLGYGFWFQGVAMCSPIEPQNTNVDSGIIPDNQTELEAEYARKARDGRICYCKMTNPSVEGSRWIVGHIYGSAGSCTGDCVSMCGARGHRTLGTRRAYLSGLLVD